MSSPALRVRELVHAYDRRPVLAIPQLDLAAGAWHLAGPNGAGKTTLLRILATLTRPTQGRVRLAGLPLPDEARKARALLGYAGHQPSLHGALPARQALTLHAKLHEVPLDRVGASLDAWGLAELADRRVERLSFGQRRRVDLARALLHRPEVLLLDEPSRGLDRPGQATLADRIQETDPELVLVAAPEDPPVAVDGRLGLEAGRLQEDAS